MKEVEATQIVKGIVDEWSRVYINQVYLLNVRDGIYQFEVEFSKPEMTAPIPEGTVKVYFDVIPNEDAQEDEPPYEVEFNFENESLKHKLSNTMRQNMFEQWINRVLENKLKIKMQLHLGTEFEYTRLVDKSGLPIDPFVPNFSIVKVQDLNKEIHKSQKINVESPRFVSTLRRALEKLFTECDATNDGELEYSQFNDAFLRLDQYNLNKEDVQMMLALADENPNGRITWRDFIPVGIRAVQLFLERNKQLNKIVKESGNKSGIEVCKDTLKLTYEFEIKMANELLQRRFQKHDRTYIGEGKCREVIHTGKVQFKDLEACLHSSSWVTPKEINLLLREYVMKQGYDAIDITKFEDDLYNVRFAMTSSRIMDTALPDMESYILEACQRKVGGKTNLIPLKDLREVLAAQKELCLTSFQQAVLLGFAEPSKETIAGLVDFTKFAPLVVEKVERMYSVEAMRRKSTLCHLGHFKVSHVRMPDYDQNELFAAFRDLDVDYNGFLEWTEYQTCLESQADILGLTVPECYTLNLLADVHGNGKIDYPEFMKQFKNMLFLIKFQSHLQNLYDEERVHTRYIKASLNKENQPNAMN